MGLILVNIFRTFTLTHAVPTCGEISLQKGVNTLKEGATWVKVKVQSMFPFIINDKRSYYHFVQCNVFFLCGSNYIINLKLHGIPFDSEY